MKKQISILPILLYSSMCFSQYKNDPDWKIRLDKIENKVNNIEKLHYESEIASLKDKLDFQQKMIEQSISGVSNQLDSASYSLTIFGILFGIAAVGLGIYVTYVERKIVKISEENKDLLSKNQKIKEDVEAVNKLIQSDIYNLFLKIKREETVHVLDRLIKVPKDILNVSDALLSRELYQEDFTKLKQAHNNLGEADGDFHDEYMVLFFQHFFAQSLRDEKLRPLVSEFIPYGIQAAFENDILKSTSDFATVVAEKGVQEYKTEIRLFFEGITKSEYVKFTTVFQTLFDNLVSRKNRFEIFNTVESVPEQLLAKIEYGNILQNHYSQNNPTESEHLTFEELKELIAAQQNANEEANQKAEKQRKKQEVKQKQLEERKKVKL